MYGTPPTHWNWIRTLLDTFPAHHPPPARWGLDAPVKCCCKILISAFDTLYTSASPARPWAPWKRERGLSVHCDVPGPPQHLPHSYPLTRTCWVKEWVLGWLVEREMRRTETWQGTSVKPWLLIAPRCVASIGMLEEWEVNFGVTLGLWGSGNSGVCIFVIWRVRTCFGRILPGRGPEPSPVPCLSWPQLSTCYWALSPELGIFAHVWHSILLSMGILGWMYTFKFISFYYLYILNNLIYSLYPPLIS